MIPFDPCSYMGASCQDHNVLENLIFKGVELFVDEDGQVFTADQQPVADAIFVGSGNGIWC